MRRSKRPVGSMVPRASTGWSALALLQRLVSLLSATH